MKEIHIITEDQARAMMIARIQEWRALIAGAQGYLAAIAWEKEDGEGDCAYHIRRVLPVLPPEGVVFSITDLSFWVPDLKKPALIQACEILTDQGVLVCLDKGKPWIGGHYERAKK